MNVINILPIFKEHFKTLREDASLWIIIVLFLVFPGLISFLLVWGSVYIDSDSMSYMVTVFSIFVGFTINVVILLSREIYRKQKQDLIRKLINHTYSNVLYELILGLIILIILIFVNLCFKDISNNLIMIFSFILYFLIINFLMTLFLIARRLYVLLAYEIR